MGFSKFGLFPFGYNMPDEDMRQIGHNIKHMCRLIGGGVPGFNKLCQEHNLQYRVIHRYINYLMKAERHNITLLYLHKFAFVCGYFGYSFHYLDLINVDLKVVFPLKRSKGT